MIRNQPRNRKKIGEKNGINIYSKLESTSKLKIEKTTLKTKTPLKYKSEKQKAKDKNWRTITDDRCKELNYTCQWCGKIGTRDLNEFNRLEGHHITPRRYNINTPENCYVIHKLEHQYVTDNNVDVRIYKNKMEWENRDKNERPLLCKL
jgi:hypothetical protein